MTFRRWKSGKHLKFGIKFGENGKACTIETLFSSFISVSCIISAKGANNVTSLVYSWKKFNIKLFKSNYVRFNPSINAADLPFVLLWKPFWPSHFFFYYFYCRCPSRLCAWPCFNALFEFADDTILMGLITNNEVAYKMEVHTLVAWCNNNWILNTK